MKYIQAYRTSLVLFAAPILIPNAVSAQRAVTETIHKKAIGSDWHHLCRLNDFRGGMISTGQIIATA